MATRRSDKKDSKPKIDRNDKQIRHYAKKKYPGFDSLIHSSAIPKIVEFCFFNGPTEM
jgi:hypothetical protein